MKSAEGQKGTDNISIVSPEGQCFSIVFLVKKERILALNINICKELKRKHREMTTRRDMA